MMLTAIVSAAGPHGITLGLGRVTLHLHVASHSEDYGLVSDLTHAQSLSDANTERSPSGPITRPRRGAHAREGYKVLPRAPSTG